MNKVFLDELVKYTSGHQKGKINWSENIGREVKFIFTTNKLGKQKTIEGSIKIIDYNKDNQMLTIKYKDKISNIKTCHLHKCKLSEILKEDLHTIVVDKNKNKWVDLSSAPLNSKGIDWKSMKNATLSFRYNDIFGELKIVEVFENGYLLVKYKDYDEFKIHRNNLLKCRLGVLLKQINYKYIYNVGDIVKNKYSEIEIIQQFRKTTKNNMNIKFYKYRCLTCNFHNEIGESSLLRGTGCPVCAGKRVLEGYNDIPTTDSWMVKYFQGGYNEAKLYTRHSAKKIYPICPDCGKIKDKAVFIYNIYKTKGIGCQCSDGISFPEKFMLALLKQLDIKFKYRKRFKWSQNKEYDFYISELNCIIETHGEQHYRKGFYTIDNEKTLEKVRRNDEIKKKLATNNGISNYIIIDCQKSEVDYIKNNILKSKLNDLFDLSKIDWLKCGKEACKNKIKEVCCLKKDNPNYSTKDIANILGISRGTVIKYLKIGNELKWCVYDKNEEFKLRGQKITGKNHPLAKKVVCLTTGEIFDTQTDASKKYNTPDSKIYLCCINKRSYSGKHPITGEKLKWAYYEDYINYQNKVI